jgi:hypothetical protein
MNCFEVEQNLWRYVDRELPASGVAAVSAHLKSCDACRKLYHDRARDASFCRGVLAAVALGPESSERIVKAMQREGMLHGSPWEDEKAPAQVVGWLARFRGRLALAAACLIVSAVGLGWLLSGDSPAVLGTFEADEPVERSSEPDMPFERFSSGRCLAGNSFYVPAEVELIVKLETSTGPSGAILTVTGPARLTLGRGSSARELAARLDAGVLRAEVQPRQVTEGPFVIRTPEAVVSVVGTAFIIDASVQGVTRLEVSHGAVDFRAVDAPVGQEGLRVTAETGPRVVRRGDRMPGVPATLPTTVSDQLDAGTSRLPLESTASPDPADAEGGVKIESSVPVELPDGGTSSTEGPALDEPAPGESAESAGSIDLDQVVNPQREETNDDAPDVR